MKRTILMILSAAAIAGNLKAQTITKYDNHTQFSDGTSMHSNSIMVRRDYTAERYEALQEHIQAREEAREAAIAAQAAAEEKAKKEAEAKQRFYLACKAQDLNNQARDEAYYQSRGGRVLQGDPIPVKDDGRYDDTDTVRLYLHDSGYDLSEVELGKVRSYLMMHGIRHVSDL